MTFGVLAANVIIIKKIDAQITLAFKKHGILPTA